MGKGKTVVNGAEPVPGAVCSTRRSRISDQQRAPRAAQQCRWIPNQHGCVSEPCLPGACPRQTYLWNSKNSHLRHMGRTKSL